MRAHGPAGRGGRGPRHRPGEAARAAAGLGRFRPRGRGAPAAAPGPRRPPGPFLDSRAAESPDRRVGPRSGTWRRFSPPAPDLWPAAPGTPAGTLREGAARAGDRAGEGSSPQGPAGPDSSCGPPDPRQAQTGAQGPPLLPPFILRPAEEPHSRLGWGRAPRRPRSHGKGAPGCRSAPGATSAGPALSAGSLAKSEGPSKFGSLPPPLPPPPSWREPGWGPERPP